MSLLSDLDPYDAKEFRGPNPNYNDSLERVSRSANQSVGQNMEDVSRGVREKSDLLGATGPEDPESEALQAKARQYHDSYVNQLARRSEPYAADQQVRIQTNDLANRAAQFSNVQSRAHLAYTQASFQRSAAIQQEISKRELFSRIFGGVGAGTGMGLAISSQKASLPEPTEPRTMSMVDFNGKPSSSKLS